MAQSQGSIHDRIKEIYRNSPLVTGRKVTLEDMYRWSLAGLGFGLKPADRMALGMMIEAEQQHGGRLSRAIQHFIEAHATIRPGVTNPPKDEYYA